jgi:hypothetical protein
MSFILDVKHADGSRTRKRVRVNGDPDRLERAMADNLKDRMKRLRDKKGWSKDRETKLLGSCPKAIWEEVVLNDGPEAAQDFEFVRRRAAELGFDIRARR